jgi:hypothetical protein
MVPRISRVAVLLTPGIFGQVATKKMLREIEDAVLSLGLQAKILDVRSSEELENIFFYNRE